MKNVKNDVLGKWMQLQIRTCHIPRKKIENELQVCHVSFNVYNLHWNLFTNLHQDFTVWKNIRYSGFKLQKSVRLIRIILLKILIWNNEAIRCYNFWSNKIFTVYFLLEKILQLIFFCLHLLYGEYVSYLIQSDVKDARGCLVCSGFRRMIAECKYSECSRHGMHAFWYS